MEMGDMEHRLMPLSDAVKGKLDIAAYGGSGVAIFTSIPWASIAGFLSCLWLLIRIGEWAWSKRSKKAP
jgi:hypothetical protein